MTYPTPSEIGTMTVPQLRTLAGTLNVSGASKMSKVNLLNNITAGIKAAKEAAKTERDRKAAEKLAAEAGAATAIAELEADMEATRNAAVVNLETLATDFVRIYPYAPWKVRKVSVADYYAAQGVSKEEDTLTFPTVIRQAVSLAMWAGTSMADTVPVKAREMALRMLGTDGDKPAVAPDAPVAHVVAMTGSSTPTIARDRVALGLASETRSAGNAGKHSTADDDSDSAPATTPAAGSVRQVISIPEMLAQMDASEVRQLITLATERLAELESGDDSVAA